MKRILLLLGLMNLPLFAWGQIYKWVDEKGATHYTETPPPGGKSQMLKIQPRNPASDGANPTPTAKSWQEQEIEFRQRRAGAEEARHKQETGADREAALRRASCIRARSNLQGLQEQRPIYSMDERGERRYIEDQDRLDLIRQAQGTIERDCP